MISTALLAVMTSATGCAWLFQDRLHRESLSESQPRCSTSNGWAVSDGVIAALNVAGVAVTAFEDTLENRSVVITSGIISAIIHSASAVTGVSWARECRQAYEDWNASGAGLSMDAGQERRQGGLELAGNRRNDPRRARAFWCAEDGDCVVDQTTCGDGCTRREAAWCSDSPGGFVCRMTRDGCLAVRYSRRDQNMGECVEWRPGLAGTPEPPPRGAAPAGPAPATPAPAPPRGFFCSISASKPTAGFCTREKAACQHARDAAPAEVADLGECGLVETAFCYTTGGSERCAPTMEACAERASSAAGVTAACAERK